MQRTLDKIKEIEEFLIEFEILRKHSYENYKKNIYVRSTCERYFEKTIQATADLAILFIKEKGLALPEEEKDSFKLLFEKRFIDSELKDKLKRAKGMRNLLAHDYGKIDDRIVFKAIKNDLIPDVNKFLRVIKNQL